ncbi:hypothetical protein EDD16DRAFT_1781644 [Pisolithus croceorrhizus]|nr:hypothetical protein EDD16DRAFT_1781644 [Pisolithus croceorrhizus]
MPSPLVVPPAQTDQRRYSVLPVALPFRAFPRADLNSALLGTYQRRVVVNNSARNAALLAIHAAFVFFTVAYPVTAVVGSRRFQEKPEKAEEDDEDENLVPAQPKLKNLLDLLPKSTFNPEDWNALILTRTRVGPVALSNGLREPRQGRLPIYHVDFKYDEELTLLIMSSNQLGGFFNRLEAFTVFGAASDSIIAGALILRGQDVKPVVEVAPDYERYDYRELDLENSKDSAFFEGALAWDLEIDDKKWQDGKNGFSTPGGDPCATPVRRWDAPPRYLDFLTVSCLSPPSLTVDDDTHRMLDTEVNAPIEVLEWNPGFKYELGLSDTTDVIISHPGWSLMLNPSWCAPFSGRMCGRPNVKVILKFLIQNAVSRCIHLAIPLCMRRQVAAIFILKNPRFPNHFLNGCYVVLCPSAELPPPPGLLPLIGASLEHGFLPRLCRSALLRPHVPFCSRSRVIGWPSQLASQPAATWSSEGTSLALSIIPTRWHRLLAFLRCYATQLLTGSRITDGDEYFASTYPAKANLVNHEVTFAWVCGQTNTSVGYVQLTHLVDDQGHLHALITRLAVDEAFRRHGFGRAMLMHVIARVPAKEIWVEVREDNRPARKLYSECEFMMRKKQETLTRRIIMQSLS